MKNVPMPFRKFSTLAGITIFILSFGIMSLGLHREDIEQLFAAATSSLAAPPVTLYLTPYEIDPQEVGRVFRVDVNMSARDPINALGITLGFSTDTLEVIGISKEKSFLDLWTEETSIAENLGEVHFSGGTTKSGGQVGTATTLTLTMRARSPGVGKIYFKNHQVYASDGNATLMRTLAEELRVSITDAAVQRDDLATISHPAVQIPTRPNPDFNNDGKINLIDVSILGLHMWVAYDPRYDLNQDGSIGLGDLSVLFAKMKEARQ